MNTSASTEPALTYPVWLSQHSDEEIAALLWRLHAEGSSALAEQFRGTTIPEPALHQLTALELATVHAACEIGAASHPVSSTDLEDTLTELFDIAGTPADKRPNREEQQSAIASLARWGLMFSPHLHLSSDAQGDSELRIPAHLPPLFEPATEELWRLADCHRCPIPTAELPEVVNSLPPRQRRLLGTLSRAGGVGNSASLRPYADPAAPLPTMVRLGVLDQLDESTARLSGRVAMHLKGGFISEPGGDFPWIPAEDALAPHPDFQASARPDAAAASTAVQTIQELTALITDLSAHPIQPLTSGGIGTREIGKIARRLNTSPETVTHQLTLLYLCNFLAREFPEPTPAEDNGGTYWALTEHALDFAEAPLATQWAMLLLGWAGANYQSWLTRDSEQRPFEPHLHATYAAELRRFFPAVFTAPNPETYLWALRPALATHATRVAWKELVEEAHHLGLAAPTSSLPPKQEHTGSPEVTATSATRALGTVISQWHRALASGEAMPFRHVVAQLATQLESVLPAPVDMLIIQGDHTIMAPGLLTAEDHRALSRIADAESTGMASVWRVSKSSFLRALSIGETPASISDFLGRMAPGGIESVPQSLRYLIDDAARALSDSSQAPEISGATGRSGRGSTPHRVPTPRRHELDPSVDPRADFARELAEAVEGFRRALSTAENDDPDTGSHNSDTRTVRATREIMTELRQAYSAGTKVRLHYVDYAGARAKEWISVIMMSPSVISAVMEDTGESFTVQPHRVAAVEVPV